ncbi:MAG: hypothetical protein KGO96_07310 [Elusimicrobia bacterium]|nr:hypothetical protein [Elusimicrobiota bacterium]
MIAQSYWQNYHSSTKKEMNGWKKFAIASLGEPIFFNGGYGCICISADRISQLPQIKAEYERLIDGPSAIGVGATIRQSYIACQVSSKRSNNEITLFQPEMDIEESSSSSSGDFMIHKAENSLKPDPDNEPANQINAPEESNPQAAAFEQPQQPPQEGQSEQEQPQEANSEDPRQIILDALNQVRQQAETIEKIRIVNPKIYEAIKSIVSAMILMAQSFMGQNQSQSQDEIGNQPVQEQPEPTQKSEDNLNKVSTFKAPKPKVRLPSRRHGKGPRRKMPVGTARGGKIKIRTPEGKNKWVSTKTLGGG